ncbi:hypothetical protein ASF63_11210 [Microbacterium sp. Leaf320]|nr:hypothetical protein ASF63_11210 [Microbacterium sp. Leaf320]
MSVICPFRDAARITASKVESSTDVARPAAHAVPWTSRYSSRVRASAVLPPPMLVWCRDRTSTEKPDSARTDTRPSTGPESVTRWVRVSEPARRVTSISEPSTR